jgi:hypothetical protein
MPGAGDFFLATHNYLEWTGSLRGKKARVMDGIENQSWTKADRFFLADALARGMSVAEVAAFLGRTEDEVRGQCEARRLPRRPPAQDS